ncbi:hypothetical protein SELMODRAFT_437216 [Selaginella moellendorffii]|uniref:Uncharacterized protein BEH1-1 n=1 Tax=Selaginella moellendorffii TaxID=88036 RepID=D8QPC6_SELML|nr:uncharacterized protein LOC9656504 [Selaginella moellendorffii]EFJ38255.1 hypothetical protein SELMODRAFT_437216 [Selaginella moellendorffii]|eukprot:XP_002960716.1 uncharacterized protein LOC9656504 [Selaginella moellendorffii]
MTSGARLPTWKERENNKKRERRRRAIASKIFSGLRQFGNYKLPKHCDNNEVLKALCAEAGWVVEEDGTTYRKGAKPVERMEVCASAPASPSPTSSYHGGGSNGHTLTTTTPTEQGTTTASGASLIPWLKGLSGTTTPTSCFHGASSAPVTPPLSSPKGSKPFSLNGGGGAIAPAPLVHAHHPTGVKNHQQAEWDRVTMAEHWLDSTTGYGNASGSWSPVIVGPAIPSPSAARANVVRPCETPDGCMTPCSDVGDSEPNVTELLSRYSGNKSGRWINGMRVVVNPSSAAAAAAVSAAPSNNHHANVSVNLTGHHSPGILSGFGSNSMVPTISSSGTATPTAGRSYGQHQHQHHLEQHHHHFVDSGGGGWMKPAGATAASLPLASSGSGFPTAPAQQQAQALASHHAHAHMVFHAGGGFHERDNNFYATNTAAAAAAAANTTTPNNSNGDVDEDHQQQQQQQQQCSPCSSSVCGVVVETGKRKRSLHELDLEMTSSITRLQAMATNDSNAPGRNATISDRLQLTLATPASSS